MWVTYVNMVILTPLVTVVTSGDITFCKQYVWTTIMPPGGTTSKTVLTSDSTSKTLLTNDITSKHTPPLKLYIRINNQINPMIYFADHPPISSTNIYNSYYKYTSYV